MDKRWIGVLACSFVGLILALATPIHSLGLLGHKVLMCLLIGVGFWIFQPGKMAFAVGSSIVMSMLLLFGVDRTLVFGGFTSDTVWILIPATAFGYVLTKTGLGRRLALLVMKTFKPTYLNLAMAWLVIGLILSAFTPSILIRISIIMPIAAGCASTLKLEPGSKGNAFILLLAWTMAVIPGSGWITGSLWGPVSIGMYGKVEGLKDLCTSALWMKAMLLPMLFLTGCIVTGLFIFFKPEPLNLESAEDFITEYNNLGPWSRAEMLSVVILSITFIMFLTEKLHHISNVTVCLASFFLLFAVNVLEPDDVQKGVSWNLIVFFGCILAFPAIFGNPDIGISAWLKQTVSPVLLGFKGHVLPFMIVAVLVMFAWRFLDIAWMIPTMALLVSMLPVIQKELGIHPLVMSSLMILAGNFTFMTYMQPFSMMGSALAKGRSWTPDQLIRYGTIYLGSSIATLLISMVYWKMTGFVK
jgi:di/tricarboxylate transporter